ncbi:MAG: M20/M25/M40 family metallo-hydrolase [Litorilinea sp.]
MSNSMEPTLSAELQQAVLQGVDTQRLLDTAVALIEVPSPTRSAGAVADRLAQILTDDGFVVERPVANWPEAPAVVVRFDSGTPGPILQFNGHLDTVHLPFIPPRVEDDTLYGSGASDMKGGIAAFVEALRVLRDHDLLQAGGILLTAHDHHEGPWGDRRQLHGLIAAGYTGDAVLLPEYLADRLPVAGRGMAIFEVDIHREGERIHETLRDPATPDVIAAGVELHRRLQALNQQVAQITAPHAGHDSVFVGYFQAGEIFNQSPTLCKIKGTRRWVTPGQTEAVLAELQVIFDEVAAHTNTRMEVNFDVTGDAFRLDQSSSFVTAFQDAYRAVAGVPLVAGTKPFVDDGNIFAGTAGIPAITHGPNAFGAHTLEERVAVSELTRVAQVYALTALGFCRNAAAAS